MDVAYSTCLLSQQVLLRFIKPWFSLRHKNKHAIPNSMGWIDFKKQTKIKPGNSKMGVLNEKDKHKKTFVIIKSKERF